MAERRFVFDTNVIVSAALFPGSVPRQAIDKAMELGKLILSERVAEELAEILGRERFDRYVSQLSRNRFLATLIAQADILDIHEFLQVCRDAKDDKFLDLERFTIGLHTRQRVIRIHPPWPPLRKGGKGAP
jgi:putative PIN family toxin of toxin-antitoxin system